MSMIQSCFRHGRTWLTMVALGAAVLIGATYERKDFEIETGPYPLTFPDNFGTRIFIPADNRLTKEGVYLGRMLFYEPLLSKTSKVSCATCHQQKLAFTDGKAFGQGIDDTLTSRSTMSLANLLWVKNFFWDSRANSLEAQLLTPLTNPHEMAASLPEASKRLKSTAPYPELFHIVYGNDSMNTNQIVKAITQFERTLISCNSRYDQYLAGMYKPTTAEMHGMDLFMTIPDPEKHIRGATCGRCHGTPKTFIELLHNNGLDSLPKDIGREAVTGKAFDKGRFRVPTLRNIALTAPYMHDGRFKTLEEVMDHYNEHLKQSAYLSPLLHNVSNNVHGTSLALTAAEKKDVITFLNMLTDSTFITDKRFSNPHVMN